MRYQKSSEGFSFFVMLVLCAILILQLVGCEVDKRAPAVCIVDSKSEGFQCVDQETLLSFFLAFDTVAGKELLCTSPYDTEAFLRACKQGEIAEVTYCSVGEHNFKCVLSAGRGFGFKSIEATDNFSCLSPKDHARVMQRCRSNQGSPDF